MNNNEVFLRTNKIIKYLPIDTTGKIFYQQSVVSSDWNISASIISAPENKRKRSGLRIKRKLQFSKVETLTKWWPFHSKF